MELLPVIDLPLLSSIWLLVLPSVMYEVVTRGLTEPIDFCQQTTEPREIARIPSFVSLFGNSIVLISHSLRCFSMQLLAPTLFKRKQWKRSLFNYLLAPKKWMGNINFALKKKCFNFFLEKPPAFGNWGCGARHLLQSSGGSLFVFADQKTILVSSS